MFCPPTQRRAAAAEFLDPAAVEIDRRAAAGTMTALLGSPYESETLGLVPSSC